MDDLRLLYPARIRRSQNIPSDEELLRIYQGRFPDSAETPYFFPAEISSNALDTYYTHMDQGTLANFADAADRGVSIQDSHEYNRLSYGRSLWGQIENVQGTPPGWDRSGRRGQRAALAIPRPDSYQRALSAAYVVPGLRFNTMTFESTDDFIKAMRSGAVEEISVGFTGGRHTCDVCGSNYYSWDCPHIAGFTYELERDGDTEPQNYLATVRISDAELTEYSIVYAGATPNAAVLRKAEMEADGGRLSPKMASVIEDRYRVMLHTRNWTGVKIEKPERGIDMEIKDLIEALGSRAPADDQTADGILAVVRDLVAELDRASADREQLRGLADIGRQYHADTVETAIAEGVRALGDAFDVEHYRSLLQGLKISAVKRMRDDWARIGDAQFFGGRQTSEGKEDQEARVVRPAIVPDAAYSA